MDFLEPLQVIWDYLGLHQQPEKADVILIPGSRKIEHAIRAAELFRAGYAPFVLPSGRYATTYGHFRGVPERYRADYPEDYDTEWAFLKAVLMKHGVPESAILREDQATYTWENAQFSRDVLQSCGILYERAILCCHAFHARRALLYYSAAMTQTRFIVCPADTPGYTRSDWYLSEKGRARVMGEVQRLGSQVYDVFSMMLEEKPGVDR